MIEEVLAMNGKKVLTIASTTIALAVFGGRVVAAQYKYTLQEPTGLAFSELSQE